MAKEEDNDVKAERIFRKFSAYDQYAKKMHEANMQAMSHAEFIYKKEKQILKDQEALQKRQETMLEHQENANRNQTKTIDQILKAQDTTRRADERYKRDISETLKRGFKDFIGVRGGVKVSKSPALAASNVGRKLTETALNFDELPPIFKMFQKGLFGALDVLAHKVIDPSLRLAGRGVKGAVTAPFGGMARSRQAKYLAENDPRFSGRENAKGEALDYLRERKLARKELTGLEKRRNKLGGIGGDTSSLESQIQNIKDFLDGKMNDTKDEGKKVKASETTKSESKKRDLSGGTSGIGGNYSELISTVDNGLTSVAIALYKIDNRITSIQGSLADIIMMKKRQSSVEEEIREEASAAKNARVGTTADKTNENLNQSTREVEEKGSWLSTVLAGVSGAFLTIGSNITGILKGISKTFGSLPDLLPDMDSAMKTLKKSVVGFGKNLVGMIRTVALRLVAPLAVVGLATQIVEAIKNSSIFGEDGEMTITGKVLDSAQKLFGQDSGLKPKAEMTTAQKIANDADTGWLDITGSKKNAQKRKWQGVVARGGQFSEEEASALLENFGILVPPDQKKKSSVLSGPESSTEKQNETKSVLSGSVNRVDMSAPVQKQTGTALEKTTDDVRILEEVKRSQANTQAPIVVAPSSVNSVNNTTAFGMRPKARFYESTFERMMGERFNVGY